MLLFRNIRTFVDPPNWNRSEKWEGRSKLHSTPARVEKDKHYQNGVRGPATKDI